MTTMSDKQVWNIGVAKAMFPSSSHHNLSRHFTRVESALNREMALRKITNAEDVLNLKLYAYATIRVENASFSTHDEKISHFNTAPHFRPPPASFAELKPMHAIYEATITQFGLDRPFAMYDHRLGNHATGMGALYKGRGFIQLTGHANYVLYGGLAHTPEIVKDPNRAGDPDVAARILAAYLMHNSSRILTALKTNDFPRARAVVNGHAPHGVAEFTRAFDAGREYIRRHRAKGH